MQNDNDKHQKKNDPPIILIHTFGNVTLCSVAGSVVRRSMEIQNSRMPPTKDSFLNQKDSKAKLFPTELYHSHMAFVDGIKVELDEYRNVFDHSPERSDQPGDIGDHVLPFGGVKQDL
jgi:hypothetical protein